MNPLAILEELDFHPSDPPDVFLSSQAQGGWKYKTKADSFVSLFNGKGKFLARPYLGENMIIT